VERDALASPEQRLQARAHALLLREGRQSHGEPVGALLAAKGSHETTYKLSINAAARATTPRTLSIIAI
jgi:hypothetical protein